MASPQLENGYVRIANEILENYCKLPISGSGFRVLLAIVRNLYGYNKKEDWVSFNQLQKITGLSKSRISESVQVLRKCGCVTVSRNGNKLIIGIIKVFKIPKRVFRKHGTVPQTRNEVFRISESSVPQTGTPTLYQRQHTKDNIKDSVVFPTPPVENIYETLMAKVKNHRPNHRINSKAKDMKIISLMLTRDKRDPNRVLKLLEWYPMGEQYMPEIFAANSLREKYDKLESAYRRGKKPNSVAEHNARVIEEMIREGELGVIKNDRH